MAGPRFFSESCLSPPAAGAYQREKTGPVWRRLTLADNGWPMARHRGGRNEVGFLQERGGALPQILK